ncbi:hypothetical protein [Dyella terrae]|uniref:hypothetical protein n=1 Tax=Dyella terrae TaxID=522259 RepID=UPI001EFDF26F|nr:hypothetical protein [Dyella terrae]ULU23784.1 hypothetical protein DYST_00682 [Dyella terrae]
MSKDCVDRVLNALLSSNPLLGDGMKEDTPIYRVLPLKYLVPDILDSRLTLSRVIGWEDTHEAAYFNRTVPFGPKGEDTGLFGLAQDWFGQCWSTTEESDALWRIYNPDGWSVRIQSTPRALIEGILRPLDREKPVLLNFANILLYLGQVSYPDPSSYQSTMGAPLEDVMTSDGCGVARKLLVKRQAFAHEAEVRLLFQSGVTPSEAGRSMVADYFDANSVGRVNHGGIAYLPMRLRLPFDWSAVTDVMTGPRADHGTHVVIQEALQSVNPAIRLTKSELYGKPHFS